MTLPVWPPEVGAGGGGGGRWTGGSPTGPSASQVADELGALKSPSYEKPYPIVYGTAAVKALPLRADISTYDSNVAFDGVTPFLMPTVTFAGALSLGPVTSVDYIVYEKRSYSSSEWKYLSKYVSGTWPNPPEVFVGDGTTTVWSGVGSGPSQWKSLALFRCLFLGMPGGKSSTPVVQAVVRGKSASHANTKRIGSGSWTMYDSLPGDIIRDLLENAVYGLGLPAGTVVTATGADGTSASSYDTYCAACGWYLALAIDTSVSVSEVVSQILTATNSVGFWSGSSFKIVPLGDSASGSYAPVLASTGLTEDDLVASPGQDAIKVTRRAWADVYNVIPVEYSADTSLHDSELATAEYMDAASVAQYGIRRASSAVSLPCIRSKEHAVEISAILSRQNSWHRSVYEFTVTARQGAALEPGDLVSLTHSSMGLSAALARIERIETSPESGTYRVEAREWITGASVTVAYSTTAPDGIGTTPTPGRDGYGSAAEALAQLEAILTDGVITKGAEKVALFNQASALVAQWQELNSTTGVTALGYAEMTRLITLFDNAWDMLTAIGFDTDWVYPSPTPTKLAALAAWMAVDTVLADYAKTPAQFRQAFRDAADAIQSYRTQMAAATALRKVMGPTGTPSSATFLRGDGQWIAAVPSSFSLVTGFVQGGGGWAPGTIDIGGFATWTVTVTGASVGNAAIPFTFDTLPAGMLMTANVTGSNTVTVTLGNMSGSTQYLTSNTYGAFVIKF